MLVVGARHEIRVSRLSDGRGLLPGAVGVVMVLLLTASNGFGTIRSIKLLLMEGVGGERVDVSGSFAGVSVMAVGHFRLSYRFSPSTTRERHELEEINHDID